VTFDIKKREDLLKTAVSEMNYTLKHSSKRLYLKFRALIYEQIAQAYDLMGNEQQAFIARKKSEILKGNKQ